MKKSDSLILVCMILVFASVGETAELFRVDLGCPGNSTTLKQGWTPWEVPGGCDGQMHDGRGISNIAGTQINAYIGTLNNRGHHNLWSRSGDPIANTGYFCAYSAYKGHPDASIELRFSGLGLIAGEYSLLTYHSWSGFANMPTVTVTGNGVTQTLGAYNVPIQNTTSDNNLVPSKVRFYTDGSGEVKITYEAAGGTTACINAFVLSYLGPMVEFESTSSSAIEHKSPAALRVVLKDPEQGESYTVDYAVRGGTAAGCGVDYFARFSGCYEHDLKSLSENWLWSGSGFNRADLYADGSVNLDDFSILGSQWRLDRATLEFAPGETSRTIELDIMDDGLNEDDETIIVELLDPTGPGLVLGARNQHTYTIIDPRATVGFVSPSSSGSEADTPALIAVSLSQSLPETATVDYAITGGTASNGTDYTLSAGTLTFAPGEVAKNISIVIVDDPNLEDPETIVLMLSNPGGANIRLGKYTQHAYEIIDNDAGVHWDGLVWYYDTVPSRIFINSDGDLEWSPRGGDQFITRIAEQRLSQPGDAVEISYIWMSDGAHSCADCFSCGLYCFDNDITCIAGTSDIRVGLFESNGEYAESDGFSIDFAGYKGYNFRFGPNMRSGPTRWVDCRGEVHKTGNFGKKPVDSADLMSKNVGLMDYIPGFELPPGQYSFFKVRLERTSWSSVRLSITLNGKTYSMTDGSSSGQPQKIDVFAVSMRNSRPYNRMCWVISDNPASLRRNDTYQLSCDGTLSSPCGSFKTSPKIAQAHPFCRQISYLQPYRVSRSAALFFAGPTIPKTTIGIKPNSVLGRVANHQLKTKN